ncbi:hypothetical protein IQ07DRAFT_649835 [Pyrenochaeta sp. DS3sAY3a]|nr:hypothetical protein IQ07DRAFT_649835 [Pyrenochaeta sp. DS3sAY3a]
MASSIGPRSSTSASSTRPILPNSSPDNSASPPATHNRAANNVSPAAVTSASSSQTVNQTSSANGQPAHAGDDEPELAAILEDPTKVSRNDELKEWRSWKIHWLYLALLLLTVTSFIIAITGITIFSFRNNGFARESQPPGFIERHPALRKAIWEQGIFYTAFPAFIMTVYRTMWDASVMAFADRQPYVDLMKKNGRSPARTILLDYKMETLLTRWILAFRNRHFLLSACMLSSLVLSFAIIPLTSFFLIMDSTLANSTLPLTFDTYFSSSFKPKFPDFANMPNIRLVLDTAAGAHLLNLSLPPHTDDVFVFPAFTTLKDLGGSNLTLQTAAYGVDSGCVEIPESEYNTTFKYVTDNALIVEVDATDRECAISHTLGIRTAVYSPEIFMSSWYTMTCSMEAGWTRIGILAARYDRASETVQNLTVISCRPSYFVTSGELTQQSVAGSSRDVLRFDEDVHERKAQSISEIYAMKYFLEKDIHNMQYIYLGEDFGGNEFTRDILHLSQQRRPSEPLHPSVLLNATQNMYETVYAVFAGLYLFRALETPVNGTGIYTVLEKRLFVVPSIAYIILGVLGATALLNIGLFFAAKQESMLKEEPYSLISYAGLLYKTEIQTMLMEMIVSKDRDPGRARETAKKMWNLDKVNWLYSREKRRITFSGEVPLQTMVGTRAKTGARAGIGRSMFGVRKRSLVNQAPNV